MNIFDDLFFNMVMQNMVVFPILVSIAIGILLRNVFVIAISASVVGVGFEFYSDGGRFIVEALVAACLAHIIGALSGFAVSRIVR